LPRYNAARVDGSNRRRATGGRILMETLHISGLTYIHSEGQFFHVDTHNGNKLVTDKKVIVMLQRQLARLQPHVKED
jgi:hypothetical protein